jgi:hypothetical protein
MRKVQEKRFLLEMTLLAMWGGEVEVGKEIVWPLSIHISLYRLPFTSTKFALAVCVYYMGMSYAEISTATS